MTLAALKLSPKKLVPATLPLRPGDVFTADGWMRPA